MVREYSYKLSFENSMDINEFETMSAEYYLSAFSFTINKGNTP